MKIDIEECDAAGENWRYICSSEDYANVKDALDAFLAGGKYSEMISKRFRARLTSESRPDRVDASGSGVGKMWDKTYQCERGRHEYLR